MASRYQQILDISTLYQLDDTDECEIIKTDSELVSQEMTVRHLETIFREKPSRKSLLLRVLKISRIKPIFNYASREYSMILNLLAADNTAAIKIVCFDSAAIVMKKNLTIGMILKLTSYKPSGLYSKMFTTKSKEAYDLIPNDADTDVVRMELKINYWDLKGIFICEQSESSSVPPNSWLISNNYLEGGG